MGHLGSGSPRIAPPWNAAPWGSPFSRNPAWHTQAEQRRRKQTRPATVPRTDARPSLAGQTHADRKNRDPMNACPDHVRPGTVRPRPRLCRTRPWRNGIPGNDSPRTTIRRPAAPWNDGLAGAERNRWRGMIRDPRKGGQSRRAYCHGGISFPPAYTARAPGSPAGSQARSQAGSRTRRGTTTRKPIYGPSVRSKGSRTATDRYTPVA